MEISTPQTGSAAGVAAENLHPPQTHRIARPTLGKEKAQRCHHPHFAARQRHQSASWRSCPMLKHIPERYRPSALAFLRHRRVVDHQYRITVPTSLSAWMRSSISGVLHLTHQQQQSVQSIGHNRPISLRSRWRCLALYQISQTVREDRIVYHIEQTASTILAA